MLSKILLFCLDKKMTGQANAKWTILHGLNYLMKHIAIVGFVFLKHWQGGGHCFLPTVYRFDVAKLLVHLTGLN